MPAPGFPSGYVYASISAPAIGRNGHVAFFGRADTNVATPTTQRKDAVWAGMPHQLAAIVKEGDTIAGIPATIQIGALSPTTTRVQAMPIVSSTGKVALRAPLKGSLTTEAVALVVYSNGVVTHVVRPGDAAVGFTGGETIKNFNGLAYAFSDAGLVYSALTTSGGYGVWYWDFQTTRFIAASDRPASMYSACNFSGVGSPMINDAGDIVFGAAFTSTVFPNTLCPSSATLRWRNGVLSVIVDGTTAKPNIVGSQFFGPTATGLDDSGGIAFTASLTGTAISYSTNWYKPENAALQLVAVNGETLPELFTAHMVSGKTEISALSNSGQLVAYAESPSASTAQSYILRGQPRSAVPYTDFNQAGASQLELIARTGMQAPGLPTSTLFESLAAPAITPSGDVLFYATHRAPVIANTPKPALWHASSSGQLQRILNEGQSVSINGATKTISSCLFGGAQQQTGASNSRGMAINSSGGLAVQHSGVNSIVTSCAIVENLSYYIFSVQY
jgi:hypothetical protein